MEEEAGAGQPQPGASPHSPPSGRLGGQGPAACGAALLSPPWGREGCDFQVWALGAFWVPGLGSGARLACGWLKCSETHRQ